MAEKRPYRIPDFIIHDLNEGKPFAENEAREIENIFGTAESFEYPQANTEANWQSLMSRIEAPMTVTKKPARQFAMFKWAAAAIVVLSIGIGFWQFQKGSGENFTAIYKTGNNKELVKLPDGTVINMNANTELEVRTMNAEERIVAMNSGEAFFKVTHNELPFKVITPKGDIMVTGTEFNIKSRQDKPFTVYLKEGKVRFQAGNAVRDMKPGECLEDAGSGKFIVSRIEDESCYAWTMNKLVFTSQPLSEIVTELESVYKVKFHYDEKLASERYNLVCDNTLTAEQVADLLTKLTNTKVSIQ